MLGTIVSAIWLVVLFLGTVVSINDIRKGRTKEDNLLVLRAMMFALLAAQAGKQLWEAV